MAIVCVCEMKYDAVYEQCETKNLRSNKALSKPMKKKRRSIGKRRRSWVGRGKSSIKSFCRNALTGTIKWECWISHCCLKHKHTHFSFDSFCLVQLIWRNENIELIFIKHFLKRSWCVSTVFHTKKMAESVRDPFAFALTRILCVTHRHNVRLKTLQTKWSIVTNLINVALLNYWAKKRKNQLNKHKRKKQREERMKWKKEKCFKRRNNKREFIRSLSALHIEVEQVVVLTFHIQFYKFICEKWMERKQPKESYVE